MRQASERERRRWPRAVAALLLVVAVALAGLWLARKPLVTRYADDFLASKGVRARYRIVDLGLGRQRLADVVLGDPAHPDLVADWLEARTSVGLRGATLTGVRGGHVRLRARLADGRLSLGGIDRLLPTGNADKPFALPALDLDVADARVRLETPAGVVGLRIAGSGRLDRDWSGQVAAVGDRLGGACGATRPAAVLRVRTAGGLLGSAQSLRLDGPMTVAGATCGGVAVARGRGAVEATLTLGERLAWAGTVQATTGAGRHPLATAVAAAGSVRFRGDARGTTGDLSLRAERVAGAQATARAMAVSGRLAIGPGGARLDGARLTAAGARLGPAVLARADALARVGGGTPVAPLLVQLARSARAAGAGFDLDATGDLAAGGGGTVTLGSLAARSTSGARAGWTGTALLSGEGSARAQGVLTAVGGGLPSASLRVAQAGSGGVRGVVTMAPYQAGGARLALSPVAVDGGRGGWRLRTAAMLSGPLADGRVDGVTMPLDLVARAGVVALNPGCAPLGWSRVAIAGLVLDRGAVRLCPTGGALAAVRGGAVEGGAGVGATRLTGRIGSAPLTLAVARAVGQLDDGSFTLAGVAARLGQPGRVTRLDAATLDGRIGRGGVGGRFAGAGGQVGAVPLLLSHAAGDWRFAGGALAVHGGLTVSDAQVDRPRLRPLPVRGVALTLRGGRIEAAGAVRSPDGARLVAAMRLVHDLGPGTGAATFTVPGLLFDKALQPDQLTPVTFGVVADVRGTVTGEGRVDWTPAGVTSTGSFTTRGADLAAAFGPVTGIAGTIRFTDLLALESAPDQLVTVRQINPGIPVTDGVVRFQTLPNARVAVAGARWPFAGGALTLAPTLLDFAAAAELRMTFRVQGMAADQFLQQFDFKNLNATGVFDGELPMVFDGGGGRIENGRLAVRPGGGQISYVGPISQQDVGFWPNLAFQALKSLRYRSLTIALNGPLAGEMVTDVRFAGISQGEGAARGGITGLFVRRLQRLPFVFNIRIRAPFRGLLDATASFYDPKRLNLPALIERQDHPIQPPASEISP